MGGQHLILSSWIFSKFLPKTSTFSLPNRDTRPNPRVFLVSMEPLYLQISVRNKLHFRNTIHLASYALLLGASLVSQRSATPPRGSMWLGLGNKADQGIAVNDALI